MNSIRIALLSLACASGSLFADTVTTANAATVSLPVPVKVVYPTDLGSTYDHETALIRFHLDRNGVPHAVEPASWMAPHLADRLVVAVSQWRFEPCKDRNGEAVERNIIVPIELSDRPQDIQPRLALNR